MFSLAPPARPARHASGVLLALAVAVLLAHLWLASAVLEETLGWGSGDASSLRRMEVSFVRELAQAAPPAVVAATPPPARTTLAAAAPASAPALAPAVAPAVALQAPPASEPRPPPLAEPSPETPPTLVAAVAPEPTPEPITPSAVVETASPASTIDMTRAGATSNAAVGTINPEAAAAFEWPPSTRLSYNLTGHYRGPVQGSATVEWVKVGNRYQVHLEVSAGGLFSRRMSSDGDTTPQGLRPRRFEQITKMIFGAPRVLAVAFDEQQVRLANGSVVPLPAGVQDTASQFVQMTWMFTLKPELLTVGRTVDIPLALPNRVETWTYEVLAREDLRTPVGVVPTLHVKPRREARTGSDLTAETWVAPSLQYLPVRIVIRQDAETFVDLLLKQLPQQAATR